MEDDVCNEIRESPVGFKNDESIRVDIDVSLPPSNQIMTEELTPIKQELIKNKLTCNFPTDDVYYDDYEPEYDPDFDDDDLDNYLDNVNNPNTEDDVDDDANNNKNDDNDNPDLSTSAFSYGAFLSTKLYCMSHDRSVLVPK